MRNRKISIGLFLLMLIIIVVTTMTIVGIMLRGANDIVDTLSRDDLTASMSTIMATMDQMRMTSLSVSLVIARDDEIVDALEAEDTARLLEHMAVMFDDGLRHSLHDFVTITNARGYVVARTRLSETGDNIAYRRGVSSAMAGGQESYIGFLGEFEELGVISTNPVHNAEGRIIGTVSVGYDLGTEEFVDELQRITMSEVTIFARDVPVASTMIHYATGERSLGTRLRPDIAEAVLERGEYFHMRTDRLPPRPAEMFLAFYAPIRDSGEIVGVIFAGYNLVAVEEMREDMQDAAFIVAFISIALSMGVFLIITRIMVHNLRLALDKEHAASLAKSRFLSNMSHEIRTPLNGIVGMVGMAKETADPAKKDDYIGKIEFTSNHLLGVINQILDISKIEAGKFELHNRSFDFRETIDKVTGIFSLQAEEKNLKFVVDMDEKIPRYIITDELRLVQIITNILSNAIKFTPVGGNVEFSAARVSGGDGEVFLRVEITDDGIGISEEQLPSLFAAFEQAEAYTTHRFGGTGLGLPISKQIIEMMGGKIFVESQIGKGSKFRFVVPLNEGEAPDITEISARDLTDCYTGRTILLAEDVSINREIVIAQLEATGITIDCAEDGVQALKMFAATPSRYDLIFMDLQMPEMDGITAARQIRNLNAPHAKTVPIVAMTANVFQDDINACLSAGMNGHLGKPLDFNSTIEILDKYLRA